MITNRSNKPLKLLWLGHWHSDSALMRRKAVNQAATTWSRGLLHNLGKQGCEIKICTHCREQLWPGGQLWPGSDDDFDNSFPVHKVEYWNLPLVRDLQLAKRYRDAVRRVIAEDRPDFVFTYNLFPYHCAAGELLSATGVKWIPIILDQADPQADNWQMFNQASAKAAGIIFLSAWGFQNYAGGKPRFHLDGGISQWHGEQGDSSDEVKNVVYSGKYDERYGGLELLFDIIKHIKYPKYRVLLTGKDPKGRLKKHLRAQPKAEYLGFVSEKELHAIYKTASVFINPRPPQVSDNRMIFPSKIHRYLEYGKPVVSTWTDGLSDEYRQLLLVPECDDPAAYARLIDRALNFGVTERMALSHQIKKWAEENTWEKQAVRLLSWLGATCSR